MSKHQDYEGGVRVPFLICWPDKLAPGETQAVVSSHDVLPTALAAAGIEPPNDKPFDGINLLPILWKIVDGVTHSWSVLDPLLDASITIRLQQPVTVTSLAVWPTVSKGLSLPKEVVFAGDGRELLQATLRPEKGPQNLQLLGPATFRELTMTVRSVHPGDNAWGSLGEIEAFDSEGNNLLLSPPRNEPRARPEVSLEEYRKIRAADSTRSVFMTLTGNFHPHFKKWTDHQREELYPAYIRAADVVGYDIYPIYGWNRPDWLHLVQEATAIGYFTHVWKPSYSQFGVPDENRQALRTINDQITRLAPAILATGPNSEVTIQAADDVRLDLLARQHQGQLYVFAVNYDSRAIAADARISVAGLAAGTQISVVDEDRTLVGEEGGFSDRFGPLEVHIYRLVPSAGWQSVPP